MLKYMVFLWAVFGSLVAGENLLSDNAWQLSSPSQVKRLPDGVFQVNAPNADSPVFMTQEVILNQTAAQPITFGADCKNLENDYPRRESTHGVYMNLTLDNGKVIACVVVAPDPKRRDWETLRRTYLPPRPVKKINFVVSFEKRPGLVQFRNIFMHEEKALTSSGMRNHGIGAASAELRNCVAGLDAQGRPFVLAAPLDYGARNYLLYTELDTGKTIQYFLPVDGGFISGAVLTDQGKYVCGLSGKVVIFDVNTRKSTVGDIPAPGTTWSAAIGKDGTVYLGNTPSTLFAVDPDSGKVKDCGRIDPEETQLYWIAMDQENWIYCGTGVAKSGVWAYSPTTGEKRQLLPEKDRGLGAGFAVRTQSGDVWIKSPSGFTALCRSGKIIQTGIPRPVEAPVKHLKYGTRLYRIDEQRSVLNYDLNYCQITWQNKGKTETFPVRFSSGGSLLTSVAPGPDGKVYLSSAHPHHLVSFDPATDRLTDLGYNPVVMGGNFCNMTSDSTKLYACEYAGGRIWEFDPRFPVSFNSNRFFGNPIAKVATLPQKEGTVKILGEILLCMGKDDGAKFVFPLTVKKAGKHFLNFRFYHFPTYGQITLRAGGQVREFDLCGVGAVGANQSIGPLELAPGEFPVEITVKRSPQGKYPWFGLTGLEFADAPRSATNSNPRILGQWPKAVMRPRTIALHPNRREVVMAGFSYDGMEGGQFGVHDLATGKNRTIEKWLPGESCIAALFTPAGNLIGGTSIDAIGGHRTAKEAAVFEMDWASARVTKVARLPGAQHVIAIASWHEKLLAAADNGMLYVINPENFSVTQRYPIGAPVRNALLHDVASDRMFLLQSSQIAELDAKTFRPQPLAKPLGTISGGGAITDGRIFFIANNVEFHEYRIPSASVSGTVSQRILKNALPRPAWWRVRTDEIIADCRAVKKGHAEIIAQTPGKFPVFAVTYGPKKSGGVVNWPSASGSPAPEQYAGNTPQSVMIVGGIHGEEPEGVVLVSNLISLLETGLDRRGKERPRLLELCRRYRLTLLPCVNMDARSFSPDNALGAEFEELAEICYTRLKDGRQLRWPDLKSYFPMPMDQVEQLGTYYNLDGYNIQLDAAPGNLKTAEAKALLLLAACERIDFFLNLHSAPGSKDSHLVLPNRMNYPAHLRTVLEIRRNWFAREGIPWDDISFQNYPAGKQVDLNNAVTLATGAATLTFEFASMKAVGFDALLETGYRMVEAVLEQGEKKPLSDRKTLWN